MPRTSQSPQSGTSSAAAPAVPQVTQRARDYVRPALEAAVAPLPAALARVCGYYFGWCDADGSPTTGRGGRCLQATMVLLTAEATGTDPHDALPAAVAVEFLHNVSLLHDDVVDQDSIRRGRPTALAAFGAGTSVVAGDALWAAAFDAVLHSGSPAVLQAVTELNTTVSALIHTAGREVLFDRTPAQEIPLSDYLAVCGAKGGALLGVSAVLSALLTEGDLNTAHLLRRAAHHAGTAWQAVNDLENIWGDETLVGKPCYQDLRAGKNTLPVILAAQHDPAVVPELTTLLGDPPHTRDALKAAARLLEDAGGRARAEAVSRQHLEMALTQLTATSLPAPVRADLEDLLNFTVTRTVRPRPSGPRSQTHGAGD